MSQSNVPLCCEKCRWMMETGWCYYSAPFKPGELEVTMEDCEDFEEKEDATV